MLTKAKEKGQNMHITQNSLFKSRAQNFLFFEQSDMHLPIMHLIKILLAFEVVLVA